MARTKASQVEDQITDAVTSAGNDEVAPSAATLAEMEAGRAVLEKIAAMAPAPAEPESKTE